MDIQEIRVKLLDISCRAVPSSYKGQLPFIDIARKMEEYVLEDTEMKKNSKSSKKVDNSKILE